ncbi:hypothetical protein [Streptomyces sp. KR55]|uniref:hypothetical protein n=1 Tax=Streptomyces sp. KR55 TaxID=3457425 RepID=UPI003FD00775
MTGQSLLREHVAQQIDAPRLGEPRANGAGRSASSASAGVRHRAALAHYELPALIPLTQAGRRKSEVAHELLNSRAAGVRKILLFPTR